MTTAIPQQAAYMLSSADALRFVAFEARECRDHDAHEALCLLLPSLLKVMKLPPMDGFEAGAFRQRFKQALNHSPAAP